MTDNLMDRVSIVAEEDRSQYQNQCNIHPPFFEIPK